MSFTSKKIKSILGLLLILGIPALPLSRWLHEFADVAHLTFYEIVWWGIALFVILYVLKVEELPLSSIGFKRPSVPDIVAGACTGALIIVGFALLYYFVLPALHFSEHKQVHQLASTPLWWKLISVVRAAVAEEIIFRGYGFERLRSLSGSTVFAALASWAIFTVEHLSVWGFGHLLIAGFGGILLTLVYVWRRNIYAAMVAHFIADLISVLAA